MGEPPRLPGVYLAWDKSVIYFLTICTSRGRPVLANPTVFEASKSTVQQLLKWNVLAGVIMPDHMHWIVSPKDDRDLSVGDFAAGFKRLLRKHLGNQEWEWQRGCFDRLLRSNEDLGSKWSYVQDNPVRAGLVSRAQDWPYYIDLVNDDGKLTASPTIVEIR